MSHLRNFGHDGPEKFNMIGINGKNSEFHAAMGLCNLKYIQEILDNRKEQYLRYSERLSNRGCQLLEVQENSEFNYAYFPIIFPTEELLLKTRSELENNKISPRRYFYQSLSNLPYIYNTFDLSVADSVSPRVLCLPMFWEMTAEEQDLIIRIVLRTLKY